MAQYVIAGKFGAIEIGCDGEEAQQRAKDIYQGYFYRAGFFEARRVRKEIAQRERTDGQTIENKLTNLPFDRTN